MANVGKCYFFYKEKFTVTPAEVNSTFGSLLLTIKFTLFFISRLMKVLNTVNIGILFNVTIMKLLVVMLMSFLNII